MNFALWLYRRLARAFPHEFKLAYGTEVVHLGEDVVEEIARTHGIAGLVRLIADIAIRVPAEYFSEMRSDMRYAARGLAKSPGFALVAIISMGLGMGLTTVVYTWEWASLFRPLPGATSTKQLVMPEKPVSFYYIEQYREQKGLFTGVAAVENGVPFNVSFQGDGDAKPQRVFGQLVSADYFNVLGVRPQQGRMLSPEVDKPGNGAVVVISDRFWRNRLNSSPEAVGQVLHLNGQPATIVGIAPVDFNGALAENPSEIFVPVTVPAVLAPELANDVLHQRNAREFWALMRLAPGVNIGSAEAALDAVTRQLDEQDPSAPKRIDKGRRVTLLLAGNIVRLPRELKPVVVGFLVLLMGLIMVISYMNLANMLLARGANRRRELAIRLAVGASRFRLVRQMMSEGILLSLLGGITGFALAYGLSVLNSHFNLPTEIPIEKDPLPDWGVGIFVFVLAIVCGIGFSLIPALRATKADLAPAMKESSALQLPGYRRFGLRNLLMVAQVTGSLMLLLITGFLVMGLSQSSSVQTKVDPRAMYLLSLDPVREGYTPEKTQSLFEKLPARLRGVPGVRSVVLTAQVPYSIEPGTAELRADDPGGVSPVLKSVVREAVGARYFAALNEKVLSGREFVDVDERSPGDGQATVTLPAVLDETAVRGLFKNGTALGQRIRDDKQVYEVVGVVPDMKNGIGINQPVMYVPLTARDFARPRAGGITIMVRSDAGIDALNGVRNEIASTDPKLTIFKVRTLNDYLEVSRAFERFAVNTYGGIGVFGLLLSAIGLAGVTAYAVAQRRKEIGIRMALGARKVQVLRLVLREGTALVTVGTVLGFAGAFAVARILSSLADVFVESLKIGTNDPRLLVGAPLLMASLAMISCYLPARRAAQIDPLRAVREE
ncbi:MAG TPA: ABC transporter permease [Candidatus Angelobacter sp.]|nr:ABC transporter permease [Candidatus Angelobacter sp.]